MGMLERQRVAIHERDDRVFTGVCSHVAAAASDATAEKQLAMGTVENGVAGRFGTETLGFGTVLVQHHVHSGDGFRNLTQGSFGPVVGDTFGPDKQHVDGNGILALPQQPIQLLDARA